MPVIYWLCATHSNKPPFNLVPSWQGSPPLVELTLSSAILPQSKWEHPAIRRRNMDGEKVAWEAPRRHIYQATHAGSKSVMRNHPTKDKIYVGIPPISITVAQRCARFARHCFRAKDQMISDVIIWRLPWSTTGSRPLTYPIEQGPDGVRTSRLQRNDVRRRQLLAVETNFTTQWTNLKWGKRS